jgi:hypothetical protein
MTTENVIQNIAKDMHNKDFEIKEDDVNSPKIRTYLQGRGSGFFEVDSKSKEKLLNLLNIEKDAMKKEMGYYK